MGKKFKIITLGCKVNQCESESLDRQLAEKGGHPTGKNETADWCVINTCAVTARAAIQSRQAVRRAIRENPGARIIVTGCHAQTEPEAIHQIRGVDQVVGYQTKGRLAEMLQSLSPVSFDGRVPEDHFSPMTVGVNSDRTRPFLKIQDGCDAFCTYCIVPHARGRSRSMPLETVVANLAELRNRGYHETVLTGIHLGTYGQDLDPPVTFFDLLRHLQAGRLPDRIRLSSIEPCELTDDIIRQIAGHDAFCRHFHIPLQSGDDEILRRMHRPYTRTFFEDRVRKIINWMPDAAIGVDTLIGFPGETDQAFENTLSTIYNLPVAYLHVFPFSPRPGTPAAGYPGRISPDVIKARCQRMRALSVVKKNSFYRRHVGQIMEVLIENKRDRITGWLKGTTSNYISVLVDEDDTIKNQLVNVRITHVDTENRVTGTVVSTASA